MTADRASLLPLSAPGPVPLALTCVLLLVAALGPEPAAADPIASVLALGNASLVVEEGGREVIADNPDQPMVPASTMKLITALAAIDRWGLDHRFETGFYLGRDKRLWVRGGGDPYLVSEEFDQIATALKAAGVREVAGIGLDDGLFAPNDRIPGRSSSNNPYDAPVTALAVNFNTVQVVVSGGSVRSGEAQTPITPTARRFGQQLGAGKHRVNLQTRANALDYFGELLAAKLAAGGIRVSGGVEQGRVPAGADLVYSHRGSRTLEAVIKNMLEYSTNFAANDLFLLLGERGGQTSMAQASATMEDWARRRFGWRGFAIEDGAGLSRGNQISGRQMIEVLNALAPHRRLLSVQDNNPAVHAKTGTLRGVSSYAGFVRRGNAWAPFALFINQPVAAGLRLQVASALAQAPSLGRY